MGARLDAETGLHDFRACVYSPKLGRFMQADPIGYEGGVNLYAYVNNDPLNLTDPSGLDPLMGTVIGAVAGAFYGAAGAAAASGSSWKSVSAGAIVGAITGGGLGFVDPSLGVATFAFLGAISGGAGDLAGQVLTNAIEGNFSIRINPGSTAGAIFGGALSGAGGCVLGRVLARSPSSEWIKSAVATSISSGPSVLAPLVGGALFESVDTKNVQKIEMNELNSTIYDIFLIVLSVALFIIMVFFLAKFGVRSNLNNRFRISIALVSVLFLISLMIFQIGLIGAVVGGGAAAGYIIIVTLFVEVAFGLVFLIRAARLINLKYNSGHEKEIISSSKYNPAQKWMTLMFVVFSFCFIILILSLYLFKIY